MNIVTNKRLALITMVYWFLLMYIIAALVFWFISLQIQNEKMTLLLINELQPGDEVYQQKALKINDAFRRKKAQYVGEGITFLAVILFGAVYVYRAARRQLMLSQQQQNFMMTVTHELKTPIAVVRLNLETVQKRQLQEDQQKKLIANTLQEADRLNSLCSNILLASQLDARAYKVNKTKVDLSELAESVVSDFSQRHTSRAFQSSIEDKIYMQGEELLLQMMMNNLVENAIKYSPKDKPITIGLSKHNNHIIFSVKDEGEGIAEAEKSKIFEKFYRVGNELTRTTKGTGLGLYLCKMIAKDHGGHINIKSVLGDGSEFLVTFKD